MYFLRHRIIRQLAICFSRYWFWGKRFIFSAWYEYYWLKWDTLLMFVHNYGSTCGNCVSLHHSLRKYIHSQNSYIISCAMFRRMENQKDQSDILHSISNTFATRSSSKFLRTNYHCHCHRVFSNRKITWYQKWIYRMKEIWFGKPKSAVAWCYKRSQ